MTTFVLIHGAYQGGWIWKPVAERLRAQGHLVFAPSLDGCAERHGLLSLEQMVGQGGGAFGGVVADPLDVKQAPAGGEADLLQFGEMRQPLGHAEVFRVIDRGFRPQRLAELEIAKRSAKSFAKILVARANIEQENVLAFDRVRQTQQSLGRRVHDNVMVAALHELLQRLVNPPSLALPQAGEDVRQPDIVGREDVDKCFRPCFPGFEVVRA